MAKGLIIAIGLDDFVAEFAIKKIQPDYIAFLATEATLPLTQKISLRLKLSATRVFFIKDIFSTSETVQEFFNAFQWIKQQERVEDIFIDATNCITVIEMATYVSASFLDLYRELLGISVNLRLVYVHCQFALADNGSHVEVRGSEELVELESPSDSLSVVLCFEGMRAFNSRRYEQAYENFQKLEREVSGEKALLYRSLAGLSLAYEHWDKMEFEGAKKSFADALTYLKKVKAYKAVEPIQKFVQDHLGVLEKLLAGHEIEVILELFANAERRETELRFDDALARLYACLERMMQYALKQHGIDSGCPNYALLADSIVQSFSKQLGGVLPNELELKKAALLLSLLDNTLGAEISKIGLRTMTGLLGMRNMSILAHGIKPVTRDQYLAFKSKLFLPLWEAFCSYTDGDEKQLEAHRHLTITDLDEVLYRKTTDIKSIVATKAANITLQ